MNYDNLKISNQQAEIILFNCYHIKGKATVLPGEVDFNFKIKTENSQKYILKIARPNENEAYLGFQQNMLQFIATHAKNGAVPNVVLDKNNNSISKYIDGLGHTRFVRLLTWVHGRIWSSVNPQLTDLRFSLGTQCGWLIQALQGFDHPEAHRKLEWDIAQSAWVQKYLYLFKKEEKKDIEYFQNVFLKQEKVYSKLRKAVVHNDANDNNIIVSKNLITPKVLGVIDFGDAVYTQIINDVAIACAYGIMRHNDPLEAALAIVKGYHQAFSLLEEELECLYSAIAMRLVISVTKSAINKIKEPNNPYLLISEKPAWALLKKWRDVGVDFAHFSFRNACGFKAHPNTNAFNKWASKQDVVLSKMFPTIKKNKTIHLDLSVSSKWIGHQENCDNLEVFAFKINQLQNKKPNKIIAGGYLEPRPIYTSSAYDTIGNYGKQSRTMHLGIDFWLPYKTPVHALFDGEIVVATNTLGNKSYGGLVILKHRVNTFSFFTLYGHLSAASAVKYKIGEVLKKGDKIGILGNIAENGNWVPHLHFQITLSLLNFKNDFPGVAFYNQVHVWKALCPDPNRLFKLEELKPPVSKSNSNLIDFRKKHLGKSLSLQYDIPLKMVRGSGQYLIDQYGRKYLDTVNNVAHVGHENFEVVKAGQSQMALINTNSRYLHDNINALAKALIDTLPAELNVLHFVNSGSEANELAVRMVKAVTGEQDIIVSEFGYHGNTNMCVDISSYKFDGKGGSGAPNYTHVFPLPDAFRGKYNGEYCAEYYVNEVKKQINNIYKKNRGLGGLIIEPIISCGGQIELPQGFLKMAYKSIRAAGGLCISDEVQTGCGRMGKTFWGFQLHGVVPDIVTIGKPLGNGHPVAAVACTKNVADKFANGMEYFNTFGGNPVSCAIGVEVLRTVKREKLQENALNVGLYLKSEFSKLSLEFPIIGDVRGQGLFLGIELVDLNKNPLAPQTNYIVNRMKNYGILMSIDGPDSNVLKIKPPMVFTKDNADDLLFYFRSILMEDFMVL